MHFIPETCRKLTCASTVEPPPTHLISIEPITPSNAFVFKAVRLRALQEEPHAFGSTYARESQFPDSEWLTRVERWNGARGAGFLAMDGASPCGMVGSLLDQDDPTQAWIVSMWTAPTHRRQGIGRLLITKAAHWASLRQARRLRLMVTSNNETAIRFYERLGFTRTGTTKPYPNDPSLQEYEMSRPLPLNSC